MNIFLSLPSSTSFGLWGLNLYCEHKYCIRKLVRTRQPLWQLFLEDSFLGGQVNKNTSTCQLCWINPALDQKLKLWPLFFIFSIFSTKIILKLDWGDNCFWIKTHKKEYCTVYSCPNFYHNSLILQWFSPSKYIFTDIRADLQAATQENVVSRCRFVIWSPSFSSWMNRLRQSLAVWFRWFKFSHHGARVRSWCWVYLLPLLSLITTLESSCRLISFITRGKDQASRKSYFHY